MQHRAAATRRRWPSSTARSSAASPSCCSRWCATSIYTAIEIAPEYADELGTSARASPTPCSTSCATRACCNRARSEPGRVLGRAFDQPRRIPLHQAGRLRARPARAGHLHRLRPGRDEGADEGRDHRARQAAPPQHALHRHHRARHHRRRVAEPDRQPPGDHAGHREAPRGVRAPGPRHHRVPRRRRHRPRRSCTCSASCCARRTRTLPFPLVLTGPTAVGAVFRADRPVPAPDPGRGRDRALPDHHRRLRRGRAADGKPACARCASTASPRSDSFFFNWALDVPLEFQQPFVPTHEAMAALDLHHGRKPLRTGRRPAPRVLRHRRRQRQGRGHAPDRGARARSRSTATPT